MAERDQLIHQLKTLIEANHIKQKRYQEQYGLSPELGCLTIECCKIASLLPDVDRLDVTLQDCAD